MTTRTVRAAVRVVILATVPLAACGTVEGPRLPPQHPAERAERPLSHDDCILLALASVPNAAEFAARRLAAAAALRGAQAWPNPTLSATWENLGLGHALAEQTYSLGVALAELFTRGTRVAIAEHEYSAACAELVHECQQLGLSVRDGYDELVAARERAALAAAATAVARTAAAAVRRFAEAGLVAQNAVAVAEVAAAEAVAAQDLADEEAAELGVAFAFALGFARPVAIVLADPLTEARPALPLEDLLRAAIDRRADLTAATEHYAADLQRRQLSAMKPRFLPSVAAGPRFIGNETVFVASLDVELPLLDGDGAAVAAADAGLLRSAAAVRRAAQRVAAEVSVAAVRHEAGLRQLREHAAPRVDRSVEAQRRTEQLFRAGEAIFAARSETEAATIAARLQLVAARLRAALAENRLQAAIGALAVPNADGQPVQQGAEGGAGGAAPGH